MANKINIFTLLIFAYSIIVCTVCKKESVSNSQILTSDTTLNHHIKQVMHNNTNHQKGASDNTLLMMHKAMAR
jgi:hypothetical protein